MSTIYLTPTQSDFINSMPIETYEDKLKTFSRIYGELQIKENNLTIDGEEQYRQIIEAVMKGQWEVDSGLVYVNIGETLGMSLFLKKTLGTNQDNQVTHVYKTCDIDDATLFATDELEQLFQDHPEYNSDVFILKEHIAIEKWGKRDEKVTENESSEIDIPEDTKESIRIIHATMQQPR